jgi:hypothetical protein
LRHSAMTHVHVPSLQIHMLLQPNARHWLTALAIDQDKGVDCHRFRYAATSSRPQIR